MYTSSAILHLVNYLLEYLFQDLIPSRIPITDSTAVWNYMTPRVASYSASLLHRNDVEARRFSEYINSQHIQYKDVLEEMAERERVSIAAAAEDGSAGVGLEEKWGPAAFACGSCIANLMW